MAEFETLFISGDRASQPAAAAADQKFYMVTDESNIVERSDGVTWTQWGPGSTGGGLAIVEAKLFTSNATTYTFSGLDGDTDGAYLLQGQILNAAASTADYTIRPNGATTNQTGTLAYWTGTTPAALTGTTLRVANITNAKQGYFSVNISAKCNPSGQAAQRYFTGTGVTDYASVSLSVIGGRWNEGATNITTIDFVSSQADGLGEGTLLRLYRYAQA